MGEPMNATRKRVKPETLGGDAAIPALKPRPLRAPPLSKAAKAWAAKLRVEYGISDAGGLAHLEVAARAWERAQQAAAHLARDGLVVTDRYGTPKPHPCCQIERSARAAIVTALRALRLDMEPSAGMGRPSDAAHWRPEGEDYDDE